MPTPLDLKLPFGDESGKPFAKLPLRVEDILSRGLVERERIEYKRGWNPEEVLHSLCAFANDFYDLDGGYIVIGIETTEAGEPIMPPFGVQENQLDGIQRKITELSHKIEPYYSPTVEIGEIQGRNVVVLRATAGQSRPYKTLVRIGKTEKAYFIRRNSSTMQVKNQEDEWELVNLANKTPYDDRVNQNAEQNDLDSRLVATYLERIKSGLWPNLDAMPFEEILLRMNLLRGAPEARLPVNVGLMFFNSQPEKFFPQTQIDVAQFIDGTDGNRIVQKTFIGPIGKQLTDALEYIQNSVLKTLILKEDGRAEARKVWNYPYEALEEILPNAVYHRSYEVREPIEVRIEPERLSITSYPGPDRSIKMEDLQAGKLIARRYRNRRIGEFLKKLDLAEELGTGIPKVRRAMRENGSPMPEFQTDEHRTYFTAILPIHPAFLAAGIDGRIDGQPSMRPSMRNSQEQIILSFCRIARSRTEIQEAIGVKNVDHFRRRYLLPLLKAEFLEMTLPNAPKSNFQKYQTTNLGLEQLES